MSTEKSNNLKNSQDHVQSLERGLKVIQAFSEENPMLTISQTAKITGLTRPTVRRILLTLQTLGFAESKNGTFSLTARTLALGFAYLSSQNMWNIAQPLMREFVSKTDESCSISVLDEAEIIYVARVPTKRIMSINLNVGSRLPSYATSMGQLLLANLPKDELEELLQKLTLERFTDNTITDKNKLIERLNQIQKQGWCRIEQQFEEGLRSIAAPIKNEEGKVIAAINCSAHAGRISEEVLQEEFLPLLIDTSIKISKAISTNYKSPNF